MNVSPILTRFPARFGKVLAGIFVFLIGFQPATGIRAGGIDAGPPKGMTDPALVSRGESLFLHYCAHCHGIKGEGDGYNADYIDKEPADLSDTEFIQKKSNQRIFRVIAQGGAGAKKSQLMPLFGQTLSEQDIWSLVAFIRKLAGDISHPVQLPEGVSEHLPDVKPVTRKELEKFSRLYKNPEENERLVQEGRLLFLRRKSCSACHQVDDEGGHVGPDLTRSGFLYPPEWLFTWIRNPQKIRPRTKMPNIGLDEREAMAVATYLANLEEDLDKDAREEMRPYLEKPGDPQRGKALFFDPEGKANCSKCHSIHGKGGKVGPSLSLIGSSRTLPFILESILNPKAVITIGYSSVMILTKRGKFLTGIKKNEDENSLDLVNKEGKLLHVRKNNIKKFKTQKISMMPGNFKDILSVEEIRDILAFLATLKIPFENGVVAMNENWEKE